MPLRRPTTIPTQARSPGIALLQRWCFGAKVSAVLVQVGRWSFEAGAGGATATARAQSDFHRPPEPVPSSLGHSAPCVGDGAAAVARVRPQTVVEQGCARPRLGSARLPVRHPASHREVSIDIPQRQIRDMPGSGLRCPAHRPSRFEFRRFGGQSAWITSVINPARGPKGRFWATLSAEAGACRCCRKADTHPPLRAAEQ